jgi:double stranded RNA-specific editase B
MAEQQRRRRPNKKVTRAYKSHWLPLFVSIVLAAEKALRSLPRITCTDPLGASSFNGTRINSNAFADEIVQCVEEKWRALTHNVARLQRYKVLAGLVCTQHDRSPSMQVIALSSGTMINVQHRSYQTLHDGHAEVLVRRALIRFCLEQLHRCVDNEESIFLRVSTNSNRFELRASVAFHLYISTAPCGDARLFSLAEAFNGRTLRKSIGLLRHKLETIEGTVPLNDQPSISCQSMSCSDKLCRWNLVGLQGK